MSDLPKLRVGRPATQKLPEYIAERMKALGYEPTYQALSNITNLPWTTLFGNLSGLRAMRVGTAWRIAQVLEVTIDDLVENVEVLLI